jgi:integrase
VRATPDGYTLLAVGSNNMINVTLYEKLNFDFRIKAFPEHEFHTWTEDEIAQYEEHWPIGSRERTAFALHLYTGQRRADVARMAWSDLAGNAISVIQAKTGARLTIILHPHLAEALRAWSREHMVILTTAFNRPFLVRATVT